MGQAPWTAGTVYFIPSDGFEQAHTNQIYFDEWICKEPVSPKLMLAVDRRDFAYVRQVSVHSPNEPKFKSWLLYKFRTRTGAGLASERRF
ncbi:hypothetical protein GON22_05650 [Paenibacillus sp. MMS18-CY102]|nr:hypothetical protein [Paenibacillus sp. MMS18-CY102]